MWRHLIFAMLPLSAFAQCASTASTMKPFVPPKPYPATAYNGKSWYGTAELWTVPWDNVRVIHGNARISAKFVYWRAGFDWLQEPQPLLSVVAKRLDAPAPLVWAGQANGVTHNPDSDNPGDMAMMTGIAFTEAGCWEVSATYRGHTLSYVLNVKP